MASPDGPGMLNYHGSQPIILQQVIAPQGFSEKNAKTATVLGALQLATGCLAVVFQAGAIVIENTFSRIVKIELIGCGLWCGIMFMITGLLGIFAGKKKTIKLTVAFLAFNIIASVIVWALVGFTATSFVARGNGCSLSKSSSNYYSHYESNNSENGSTSRTVTSVYYYTVYSADAYTCYGEAGQAWQAIDSVLLLLAIFEFAVAITSAAYCCKALSCCCQISARLNMTLPDRSFWPDADEHPPATTYFHYDCRHPSWVFVFSWSIISGRYSLCSQAFLVPLGPIHVDHPHSRLFFNKFSVMNGKTGLAEAAIDVTAIIASPDGEAAVTITIVHWCVS